MRVDDGDEFPFTLCQLLVHRVWIDESQRIPSEVLLLLCVLNVKPNDIIGNLELVELAVHILNVFIRDIVPSTLVVSNSERLRHSGVASEFTVLTSQILRSGSQEDKDIQKPTLGDPMRLRVSVTLGAQGKRVCGRLGLDDIDPGLSSVQPKNTDG